MGCFPFLFSIPQISILLSLSLSLYLCVFSVVIVILNLFWVDLKWVKWVFFAFAKTHLFFLILVVAAVPDLAGGGGGIYILV
jgi:hypothetical protein